LLRRAKQAHGVMVATHGTEEPLRHPSTGAIASRDGIAPA